MWKKRGKKLAQKRKKIGIAAAAVIVAAAGSTLIYHNLPQTKVEKQLTLAAKYMTELNYLEAPQRSQWPFTTSSFASPTLQEVHQLIGISAL